MTDQEKDFIRQFAASLCLADHLGDAWEDYFKLTKELGVEMPEMDAPAHYLDALWDFGVKTTIWGSSIEPEKEGEG